MPGDVWFYVATAVAVILLGVAKGGLAGAGLLAMPLMSLVMPPLRAGAILLPLLLMQDAVTVTAFRRHFDAGILRRLIPAGIAGVVLGYLLAAHTSTRVVEAVIGSVALGFAILRALRPHSAQMPRPERRAVAWLTGIASGFTSQVAHSGAPPFQIYMVGRRLPTPMYLGTAAIFFAAFDLTKLPAFIALGQMRAGDLLISAAMAPVALASSWGGVCLMRRLPAERLYPVITAMLFGVGALLLARAVLS